jgi:hypothetical protein
MLTKFACVFQKTTVGIQFIVLIAGFTFTGLHGKAQTSAKSSMAQSSYYDAVALYYAMKNYSAFPIEDEANSGSTSFDAPVDTPAIDGNGGNPLFPHQNPGAGAGAQTTVKYKIIESATGKVIMDNCSRDKIDSVLNSADNQFPDDNERKAFIYEILARNANTEDASEPNIKKLYKDNVYFINDGGNTELSFLLDPKNYIGNYLFKDPLAFPLDGGAGITQTQILEGITEFLIEAVNKEINEAFFIHLQKALAKSPELKTLFPKTLESLSKIEVTKYASSLNALKSAFEEDIKNLLSNVSKLTELEKYQKLIDKHPVLTLIFTACDLISLLKDKAIPADILYHLGNAPYIRKCKSNNYSSTIKLAALISNSLRNVKINDENTNMIGWIDKNNLNMLKNNKSLFRVFMGLFAQQAESIIFFDNNGDTVSNFQKSLFNQKKEILKAQYIVYNFSTTVDRITEDISRVRTLQRISSKKSDYISVYLQVANEIIGLSENCLDVLPSNKTTTAIRVKIKTIKQEYLPMLERANSILNKIEEKEYSGALYETDTLLGKIFNSDGNSKEFEEIRKAYIKYGLFICAVAEAKNSSDVKAAINAVALPTGSSRIKKEHYLSIGLNAYVGVYHAWNKQYSNLKLPKREFGITAPIGIAISRGHFIGNGSITLYGGIIDIGAIFTYKVNSDSTIRSDIQLSQVLSPSIGIVYGLPVINKYNIPLSIGVNYQWGPKLKKVDDAGNSVLPLLTQRVNVFVAVDIPIINFHVSKK